MIFVDPFTRACTSTVFTGSEPGQRLLKVVSFVTVGRMKELNQMLTCTLCDDLLHSPWGGSKTLFMKRRKDAQG